MAAEFERKRRLDLGNDSSRPLKRSNTNETTVPSDSNGDVAQAPQDEGLESYRKEAIWRQMHEYKREYGRSHDKIVSLQSELEANRVRSIAVEACWDLLVETIRVKCPQTVSAANGHQAFALARIPTEHDQLPNYSEAVKAALDSRANETRQLLDRLFSNAPTTSQQGSEIEMLRAKCQDLAEESLSTRSQLQFIYAELASTRHELERTHEALLRSEKQADRAASRTVQEVAAKLTATKPPMDDVKEEDGEEEEKPPSPVAPVPETPSVDSVDRDELIAVQNLAASRLIELNQTRSIRVRLERDLEDLRIQVILASPLYRALDTKHTALRDGTDRTLAEAEAAQKEADELRERQGEWRAGVIKETTQQVDEANKRVAARDADIIRIRAGREDFRAELVELKAREAEKFKQIEQIRTLANSRQDRVHSLLSEVRRLRVQIAALQGNTELVDAHLSATTEDEVVERLQSSLKEATTLSATLREQLETYAANAGLTNGQVEAETAVRQDLERTQARVAQLEKLFAADAGADPELSAMAGRLAEMEKRLTVAETKARAAEASNDALVTEIEKLSSAWQTLDEQNRDKVLTLVQTEDRLNRLASEKAKADNRYFSAMRSKEAVVAENAVHVRTAAAHLKMIESYKDSVTSLTARLTAAEKEITLQQDSLRMHRSTVSHLEAEAVELRGRMQEAAGTVSTAQQTLIERAQAYETEQKARVDAEETAAALEVQLEKTKKLLDTANATLAGTKRTSDRKEADQLRTMLLCPACNKDYKSHVITRCYHLLCKGCIDARITNRARKCPTCSAAFGVTDVAQVYFN